LTIIGGALALAAPAASAQTGYPPGNCTTLTGSQNAGTVDVGQTFTIPVSPTCVFTPGAAVNVTVNGVNIPGKVANASGVVAVTITVVSATQLSVDDPVSVPSQCGGNTVVATGPSAAAGGSTVTQSAGFRVRCPAATANATKGTVAFTGANIAKWSAGALVLIAGGFGLLFLSRRRKRDGSAVSA
jgi:hypothetical protein